MASRGCRRVARKLTKNELEQLALEPGEAVLAEAERNTIPLWVTLIVLGMAMVTFGIQDPIFGWGWVVLGMASLSFIGAVFLSMRVFVTTKRIIRIGPAGKRSLPRKETRVTWSPAAFGEALHAEAGGVKLRLRFIKNGDAVREALA